MKCYLIKKSLENEAKEKKNEREIVASQTSHAYANAKSLYIRAD